MTLLSSFIFSVLKKARSSYEIDPLILYCGSVCGLEEGKIYFCFFGLS